MNKVLDEGLPLHPLKEQQESVRDWRQIGLGVMGIADMLIKMGIRYGSEDAVELCDVIGNVIAFSAIKQSAMLAKEQGAYPKFNASEVMTTRYYREHVMTKDMHMLVAKTGLRNSQLLTIAPTGTLSTMLGISGGIEPIYANYYLRKTESLHGKDVTYKVYTPIVDAYMKEHGLKDDSELPDFFVTAQTLNYHDRIAMQSVWQRHIDASISSTVNVPNEFTIDETVDLYMEAWEKGLKGITIFRDGCKRAGVFSLGESKKEEEEVTSTALKRGEIAKVTDDVIGRKRRLITGCGSLHCTAFFDPVTGNLLETYLSKGSTGGCANFMVGLSRMVSLSARGGIDIHDIIDQLNSCGACPSYAVRRATKGDTSKGACCPIAIGNALLDMWTEVQGQLKGITPAKSKPDPTATVEVFHALNDDPKCPKCGEHIVFEGGCNICKACGWSKCD